MTDTREVKCHVCGETKTLPADIALQYGVPKDMCFSCWMRREAEELG